MSGLRFSRPPGGTRFRLYPKAHEGYLEPETVWLSPPPAAIAPGPADRRMHVVDALDKEGPYDPPRWAPPYRGRRGPPALPARDGHFDWIPIEHPSFPLAHMYGSVRRVLDVWEALLGRPIAWWHAATYPSLELIPLVHWDNAQSGGGFIEMGARPNDAGALQLFCLNFEIVGHETGHAIIFSAVGVPEPGRLTGEYLAFQESFADLIALISVMFFDSVIDRLLAQTHGNLYVLNMLNRIGELSQTQQIRIADNETRLRDLESLSLGPDGAWIDESGAGRNAHDLAQPLTGAIFDIIVEIFQDRLAQAGLIPADADARGWTRAEAEAAIAWFDRRWGSAFAAFAPQFRAALIAARDLVGGAIALVLERLDANDLSFARVASLFLEASLALGQGHRLEAFRQLFLDRDIRAELPAAPHGIAAHGHRAPASSCLADQVAALSRARALAAAQRQSMREEERRTTRISRVLRQVHRDSGSLR